LREPLQSVTAEVFSLGEHGHAGAAGRVKVGLGTTPVGNREPVPAIVRDHQRDNLGLEVEDGDDLLE
jgi:hypothetical protein